jgi:hypothetical protein
MEEPLSEVPRGRGIAWVVLPLLILAIYSSHNINYMLPAFDSQLGENYQPLRALKFYASKGADYHKYGPAPNLLLAPVYAPSIGWWWLTDTFSKPSGDFPYGLDRPLEQLTSLIRGGRILFMLIGLACYAFLLVSLRRMTPNVVAITVGFMICLGSNYAGGFYLANTRPDGLTFAFVALALGFYVRILFDGPTKLRAALMSLCAVVAISCKELAGPVFVLPYLAMGIHYFRESAHDVGARRDYWGFARSAVGMGLGSYFLLNVMLSPSTWFIRMSHWVGGAGTSSGVWRHDVEAGFSSVGHVVQLFEGFLSTLGPGGLWIGIASIAALIVLRPRMWGMLLLPFVSVLLLGLIPLGLPGDRFFTVATTSLVPAIALGLATIWTAIRESAMARPALALVVLALAANLLFATWTWHKLKGLEGYVIERSLAQEDGVEGTINLLSVYPLMPGKHRLVALGYDLDHRSVQELIDADPATRPDRIYLKLGLKMFWDHAKDLPERRNLLAGHGFNIDQWESVEKLGYRLREEIVPVTPDWFPFDWMPTVRYSEARNHILLYVKN